MIARGIVILLLAVAPSGVMAQHGPVFPFEHAPIVGSRAQLDLSFGYTDNTRVAENDPEYSTLVGADVFGQHVLELMLGQFFFCGHAGVVRPLSDPAATTWELDGSAGWSYGDLWTKPMFACAEAGIGYNRRWIYEIFGPPTRDDHLRRAEFFGRGQFAVSTQGIGGEARIWGGWQDFSRENGEIHWDLPDAPVHFELQRPRAGLFDNAFAGGMLWIYGSVPGAMKVGPYAWISSRVFPQHDSLGRDGETSGRSELVLYQYQVGTRADVRAGAFQLQGGWYWRGQESRDARSGDSARGSILGFGEWGWWTNLGGDWDLVAFEAQFHGAIREYALAPSMTTEGFGREVQATQSTWRNLLRFTIRPLDWMEMSVEYAYIVTSTEFPGLSHGQQVVWFRLGLRL